MVVCVEGHRMFAKRVGDSPRMALVEVWRPRATIYPLLIQISDTESPGLIKCTPVLLEVFAASFARLMLLSPHPNTGVLNSAFGSLGKNFLTREEAEAAIAAAVESGRMHPSRTAPKKGMA